MDIRILIIKGKMRIVMSTNILVVDDEQEIADLIEVYLKNENYRVFKFYNGKDALAHIEKGNLDLAILDVMLPDIDGFSICKRIREKYTFPVIMLTAKEEEIDKINGLTLGADDYITKPFRPLELIARVKAQIRRFKMYNSSEPIKDDRIIAFSGLVLNLDTHECKLNERILSLTPIEFKILWFLCANRGRVISSEELFHEVWGDKYFSNSNNTVMVHIRHLREKMNDSAERPKYIKTVWGVGYKIEK
jgi:two-component system response regulator VanR